MKEKPRRLGKVRRGLSFRVVLKRLFVRFPNWLPSLSRHRDSPPRPHPPLSRWGVPVERKQSAIVTRSGSVQISTPGVRPRWPACADISDPARCAPGCARSQAASSSSGQTAGRSAHTRPVRAGSGAKPGQSTENRLAR